MCFCLVVLGFSSLLSPVHPLVERQSYILPTMVQSMTPTVTEKGITSRHILGMNLSLSLYSNCLFISLISCFLLQLALLVVLSLSYHGCLWIPADQSQ